MRPIPSIGCALLGLFAISTAMQAFAGPPHSHHHHHGPVVVRPSISVSFGSPRYSVGYGYGVSYRSYSVGWPNYWHYSSRVSFYDPLWHSGYHCYTPLYGGYIYPGYVSYSAWDVPPPMPVVVAKPAVREVAARPIPVEPEGLPRDRAEEARKRSERYLFMGDKLFSHRQYHEALNQYKVAAAANPDSALPHLRQALALVATDRFPQAAAEFRKALDVEPRLAVHRFRMEDVYGDRLEEKNAHVDALAQAALDDPKNSDLLFAIGMVLKLDGKADRADRFLSRAAELSVQDETYVRNLSQPAGRPQTADRSSTGEREL